MQSSLSNAPVLGLGYIVIFSARLPALRVPCKFACSVRGSQGEFAQTAAYLEDMHGVKRADVPACSELPAPEGLWQSELAVEAELYLVLGYPLPAWELPAVLTSAEQEIARAILSGRSRREVARARGSSVRTVSNLLSHVFRKLGVRSRIELAASLSSGAQARRGAP